DLIGVAFDEADVLDWDSQAIGRDLAKRDLVPLSVRMTAGEHGHLAVAVHAHDGALPAAVQAAAPGEIGARPGARLVDERGKPDPHEDSLFPQLRLLAPQLAVVRDLEEAVEQRRRIAGIVDPPAGGGIRELAARDEIAPAQLHRVDAELAR